MKLSLLMALLWSWAAFGQVRVIVHASNPVNSLTADQVSDFFLKKRRQWSNGVPLRFFDRNDGTPERIWFLNYIVQRSAREVEMFWIGQKINTGNSAPAQVSSDQLTVALVSRFAGAIGYVSADFDKLDGVKVITITAD